jgi:hypothetical protein
MTTSPIPLSRRAWQRLHFKPIGRCAWEHLAFAIEHQRPPTLVEARALHAPFYPIKARRAVHRPAQDHLPQRAWEIFAVRPTRSPTPPRGCVWHLFRHHPGHALEGP